MTREYSSKYQNTLNPSIKFCRHPKGPVHTWSFLGALCSHPIIWPIPTDVLNIVIACHGGVSLSLSFVCLGYYCVCRFPFASSFLDLEPARARIGGGAGIMTSNLRALQIRILDAGAPRRLILRSRLFIVYGRTFTSQLNISYTIYPILLKSKNYTRNKTLYA